MTRDDGRCARSPARRRSRRTPRARLARCRAWRPRPTRRRRRRWGWIPSLETLYFLSTFNRAVSFFNAMYRVRMRNCVSASVLSAQACRRVLSSVRTALHVFVVGRATACELMSPRQSRVVDVLAIRRRVTERKVETREAVSGASPANRNPKYVVLRTKEESRTHETMPRRVSAGSVRYTVQFLNTVATVAPRPRTRAVGRVRVRAETARPARRVEGSYRSARARGVRGAVEAGRPVGGHLCECT